MSEKTYKMGDYEYFKIKDHSSANSNGFVLKHRVVMENYLGRKLEPDEVVHHLDENKQNNDISNLELMTNHAHTAFHNSTRKKIPEVKLKCPYCGTIFTKPLPQVFIVRGIRFNSCSRRCMNLFGRFIDDHGLSSDIVVSKINSIIV